MIGRMAFLLEDDGCEEVRKKAVRKQMSKLDNPVKEGSDLAKIQEIACQREDEYIRGVMDQEARTSQYRELMKEEEKE